MTILFFNPSKKFFFLLFIQLRSGFMNVKINIELKKNGFKSQTEKTAVEPLIRKVRMFVQITLFFQ